MSTPANSTPAAGAPVEAGVPVSTNPSPPEPSPTQPFAKPETGTAPRIVVLGSLNMDIVIRLAVVPASGETVAGQSIDHFPGGKGGNQAVSCARQGAAVRMVGCVGDDANGKALRAALALDRIDTANLLTDGSAATGTALILVEDGGHNRIVYVAGTNALLTVDEDRLAAALADTAFLIVQLETPLPTVLTALRGARRAGCQTVLNPSPVAPLPDEAWSLLDLVVLNEHEAQVLGGGVVDSPADAARAARRLLARGPARIVITLGSAGAVSADREGCRHHPAPKVQAVDTTAAGDTFLGALTAALARGDRFDVAVADGIRAAALCITRRGAQPSIPTRDEVVASAPAPAWSLLTDSRSADQ